MTRKSSVLCFMVLLVSFIFVSGCLSLETATGRNRAGLPLLNVGMSEEAVLKVMGTAKMNTYSGLVINNPYRVETKIVGDKTYRILMYVTDIKSDYRNITDDELTPLVFYEGKLIGWGWSFLNDRNVSEIRIR